MFLLQAAQILAARRELVGAEMAYTELVRQAPNSLAGWKGLLGIHQLAGKSADVARCRQRIARIEIDNLGVTPDQCEQAVAFRLAPFERPDQAPSRMPGALARAVFDEYADHYEDALVRDLGYRGPALVRDALAKVLPEKAVTDMLDLGCGTGLAGVVFRPQAKRLTGVDLSQRMVEKARERGLYDELVVGEAIDFLANQEAAFDIVIAVDVLEYFGDLTEILWGIHRALRSGGLTAFTVEKNSEPGYRLQANGRFMHNENYARDRARAAGLEVLVLETSELRMESHEPVEALVAVLGK
jgi:predicted TPR repeat methyltransferase